MVLTDADGKSKCPFGGGGFRSHSCAQPIDFFDSTFVNASIQTQLCSYNSSDQSLGKEFFLLNCYLIPDCILIINNTSGGKFLYYLFNHLFIHSFLFLFFSFPLPVPE